MTDRLSVYNSDTVKMYDATMRVYTTMVEDQVTDTENEQPDKVGLPEPPAGLQNTYPGEPQYEQPDEQTGGGIKSVPFAVKVVAVALLVVVVSFAFIWEHLNTGGLRYSAGPAGDARRQVKEEKTDHSPPRSRSKVQDALSELEWVEPAFLPVNEYSRPGTLVKKINAVVIHYIGNPGTTAAQNRNYFANLEVTQETSVSSNFIIGLDGEIIQCVPVDEIAYASNNRNGDTVSVELCHPDETGEFTEETYASAVRLTAWLCGQYGLSPDNIIRHYDITEKICPKYFVENEDAWEQFKNDVAAEMSTEE